MDTRKCRFCNGAIPSDKRADSKFCSNSCKANYWEANKEKPKIFPEKTYTEPHLLPPAKPLEGLRGVIDNSPKTDVKDVIVTSNSNSSSTLVQVETKAYKDALIRKQNAEDYLKELIARQKKCETTLQNLLFEKGSWNYQKSIFNRKVYNVDIQDLFPINDLEELNSDTSRKQEVLESINELTYCKKQLSFALPLAKKAFEEALFCLKNTPQYETSEEKFNILSLWYEASNKTKETIKKEPLGEPTETAEEPNPKPREGFSNGKLISSRELREMNYKCLNFQGKWQDFFGLPAVVFHLAVHGKPGEGKSTFCIQFADYLAKNFGEVVYISGEEGFSKTLRDKVVNNKIDNPHLFFADISSFEQIRSEIENNKFHFIFIDSLDTLRIDVTRLRELREYYPQSAFITISQSTKDGKMRGSQEIIHDTDIAVKVEDGIAMTTKNRYKARGEEFRIFPDTGNSLIKSLPEPRNVF